MTTTLTTVPVGETPRATGAATETARLVREYPLFANLPAPTQEQLAGLLETETYPEGARVFELGDVGDAMYFVARGRVRFQTRDYTGTPVILEDGEAGDLFGEVALFNEGTRNADALALEPTILLVLRRDRLTDFLRVCPEGSEYVIQRMASRLTAANKILRRATVSVEEQVNAQRSFHDRMVKRTVDLFGTIPFFVGNLIFILAWLYIFKRFGWDDNNLDVLIGIEGLLMTILLLMNQKREAKEESVRDRAEYEATLHADNSIKYLHEKVDTLTAEVRRIKGGRSSGH
jgi:CRP-like cAMP-binding protein